VGLELADGPAERVTGAVPCAVVIGILGAAGAAESPIRMIEVWGACVVSALA